MLLKIAVSLNARCGKDRKSCRGFNTKDVFVGSKLPRELGYSGTSAQLPFPQLINIIPVIFSNGFLSLLLG
jgi:hypothetical protein